MHLRRNSKRDMLPRHKGIPMISIGDEWMKTSRERGRVGRGQISAM